MQRLSAILVSGILACSAAALAQSTVVATPAQLNLDNSSGPDVISTVTLSTTSTTPISFTVPAAPSGWLTVKPTAGSVVAGGPVTLTLEANVTGLDISTYNVLVPIMSGGQMILQIPVYFTVRVVTGLSASPSIVGWQFSIGGASPPQQAVTLTTSSATFNAQVSANATSWLGLTVPNASPLFTLQAELNDFPTNAGFIIAFNSLGQGLLAPGNTYTGTVMITDANSNTTFVSVTLTVLNSGASFTVSPSTVTLTSNNGLTASSSVNLNAPNPTAFSTSVSINSPQGGTWLGATPSGIAPQTATITANPSGLPTGTYLGTVTFTASGLSAVVQVTFTVTTPVTATGNVVSDKTSLSFSYLVGGAAPPTQIVNISDQSGNLAIPFTVSTQTPAGTGNWLSAAVAGGGTQGVTGSSTAAVVVTVNPQNLPPGNYTGNSGGLVNITPVGGNVLGIPINVQVTGTSTVTATPLQLSFAYQAGNPAPPAAQVQVTGNAASLPFTVLTATQSGGNWLSASVPNGVTSATPGTPVTVSISVAPGQLGAGSYMGTVTIAGSSGATGTTNIQVVLTVTVLLPSITSVVNAASYLGGPIAPGEIISIFGSNLGPSTPVGLTFDSSGKVSTNIGNVQVLFNGTAAPLTYVAAGQINCVVPYEFAQVSNSPFVQVKYLNQSSNIFNVQQGATSPAIFTASNGTGQGAILNADNTYNGSVAGTTPAAKGSVVQVFMTGEGQTSPAGVTGSVTCSAGCASTSQIPKPVLPVAALVNQQPATISFFGEAPGLVSGVLQVNVVIPPGTPSGAVPIVLTVGSTSSQSSVTVQVQ